MVEQKIFLFGERKSIGNHKRGTRQLKNHEETERFQSKVRNSLQLKPQLPSEESGEMQPPPQGKLDGIGDRLA
jgi:hypothetical protein